MWQCPGVAVGRLGIRRFGWSTRLLEAIWVADRDARNLSSKKRATIATMCNVFAMQKGDTPGVWTCQNVHIRCDDLGKLLWTWNVVNHQRPSFFSIFKECHEPGPEQYFWRTPLARCTCTFAATFGLWDQSDWFLQHVRFKVSFEDVFAMKKHHTSHDNAKRAKRAKQQVARRKFV